MILALMFSIRISSESSVLFKIYCCNDSLSMPSRFDMLLNWCIIQFYKWIPHIKHCLIFHLKKLKLSGECYLWVYRLCNKITRDRLVMSHNPYYLDGYIDVECIIEMQNNLIVRLFNRVWKLVSTQKIFSVSH